MKKINRHTVKTVKKVLRSIFFSLLIAVIHPSFVFADPPAGGTIEAKLDNPLSVGTMTEFIGKILEIVTKIGTPIAVLAIIYTGFLFVKAQGNETELAAAKKAFFWTIVGVLILLGASVLGTAISGTVTDLQV